MGDKQIKQANRKALPKFILIMVISVLAGFAVGFFSTKYRADIWFEGMQGAADFFGIYLAPWLMLVLAVVLPAFCIPVYRSAKKQIAAWDGENEEVSDAAERKLSTVIWATGVSNILSFFLMAASYSCGVEALADKGNLVTISVCIVAFVATLIEELLIQQKCVDAAKKLSPEKTASVYDMKFQKKWMDSCDEAEKIIIGKCAYKAHHATNTVCLALAVIFTVGAMLRGTGILPVLIVCVIWLVSHTVYCREAMKYSKAGIKIS